MCVSVYEELCNIFPRLLFFPLYFSLYSPITFLKTHCCYIVCDLF